MPKKRRGRPASATKKPVKAARASATKAKPARGGRPRKAVQAPTNGAVLTIPQAVAIVRQIEALLAPFDRDVRRHLMEAVKA